jgi:hypothetical protein
MRDIYYAKMREVRQSLCGHVVDGTDRSLGAEPSSLDERVPVDPGEEVLLEVVVKRGRLVLRTEVRRESFFGYSSVLELGEPIFDKSRQSMRTGKDPQKRNSHELVVTGEKRARSVSIVLSREILLLDTIHGRSEVIDENGSLRRDSGGGLGVGKRRSVSEREDVGEFRRLGGGSVDSDPSSSISYGRR